MSALLEWLTALFEHSELAIGLGANYPELEIAVESETELVLCCGRRRLTAHTKYRTIKVEGARHIPFKFFKTIDISQHSRGEDGEDKCWRIRLRRSWYSSLYVGENTQQIDASIIAARLSTRTGIPVRAA